MVSIGYYTASLALHYFQSGRQTGASSGSDATNDDSKSIIFISSLAAYMDYTDTPYTSSKYGVRGLFRSIRTRAKNQNVRCNNIAPWHMKTAQTKALEEHFGSRGLQEGRGYTFAGLEILIEAVCQFAVDRSLCGMLPSLLSQCEELRYCLSTLLTFPRGRSFAIMPEGYVDLKEDFDEGYAGLEVTKALQRRYDAGDQMYNAD